MANSSIAYDLDHSSIAYDLDLKILQSLQDRSFLLLAATLSTRVKSDFSARSYEFRELWDKYLTERIERRLPRKFMDAPLFLTYIVECGDKGTWHFHGTIAIPPEFADRYWTAEGINHHLQRDLEALRHKGNYRSYAVTSVDVQPVKDLQQWLKYCRKPRQEKLYDPAYH